MRPKWAELNQTEPNRKRVWPVKITPIVGYQMWSVLLNIRVWDAANSGTKCNAIQMRPNVARRSQTSQQTLVQWHQRLLYSLSLCTCRQLGDWVAADSLSCATMFSGDAVMRSCVRLQHCCMGLSAWAELAAQPGQTYCEQLTDWADASYVAMSTTDSTCQFCCRIIASASCIARRSASISGYADMTVFNSSVFVSAAIKIFSSCMYACSPGWSCLSFSWVTAVSTTWKNWLRKYYSGVVPACAGAEPQSRLGWRLCRGNSGNGTSLSRHNITASSNRAWNLSSSRRSFNAPTVIFIAVTIWKPLICCWTGQHGWGFQDDPLQQQHILKV